MRQSVQELMERYQNNLFAAAFNVCKSREDAEDVVQDTFLQYHMNKKQFENEQTYPGMADPGGNQQSKEL